jgi:hypothetical protein
MKLILKHRGKVCEAFEGRPEYSTLKASEFLKLTTTPELYADIKNRISKGYLSDFDMEKAGQLQLSISKDGRILSHEGRHRCMAAIAKFGPDVLMKVNTYLEGGGSMEAIPEFKGQYDPSITVDLSEFDYDSGPLNWEDPLDLGDWGSEFKTVKEFEKWCNSRYNSFNEKYEITLEKFVQFINYYYQFSSVDGERARVDLEDDKIIMPFQAKEPFYVKRLRREKK